MNVHIYLNVQGTKTSSEGQWCKSNYISPDHNVTVWAFTPRDGQESRPGVPDLSQIFTPHGQRCRRRCGKMTCYLLEEKVASEREKGGGVVLKDPFNIGAQKIGSGYIENSF